MLPTFIVIGAAKAGTTALYWYLAEHPQIFMSRVKETNYFAYGVDDEGKLLYGDPELHRFPLRTLAEYEESFAGAGGAVAVGEVSPIYLECPQAAGRIRRRKRLACRNRDCERTFDRGVCPDHPDAGVTKIWVDEQLKPGVVDWPAVQARLREKGIVLVGGGADEAPQVYKRLPDVLAAHADSIRVRHTLRPLGVAMAGRDVHDPYKD